MIYANFFYFVSFWEYCKRKVISCIICLWNFQLSFPKGNKLFKFFSVQINWITSDRKEFGTQIHTGILPFTCGISYEFLHSSKGAVSGMEFEIVKLKHHPRRHRHFHSLLCDPFHFHAKASAAMPSSSWGPHTSHPFHLQICKGL